MFQVHKQGYVSGTKMVDGMLPYDFFCEDEPSLNLFVFTGAQGTGNAIKEQTLWGFARLERFEALAQSLIGNQENTDWIHCVNVLTGPALNGTATVKFQRVVKILKHTFGFGPLRARPEYEIHTDEGDVYFTQALAERASSAKVIYRNAHVELHQPVAEAALRA